MKKKRPYRVVKETLKGTNIALVSFLFHNGANVYAFSYRNEGKIRHILVDSGDTYYRNEMLSILTENGINPSNIEKIFITHTHRDHLGLGYLLARHSSAKIVVQESFKKVLEESVRSNKRISPNEFDPSLLKDCEIEYLPAPGRNQVRNISGTTFVSLTDPIRLGEIGSLEILAPPQSNITHSSDQLLVLYSPRNISTSDDKKTRNNWRPTDSILFAGDLWLMHGPVFSFGTTIFYRRLRMIIYRAVTQLVTRRRINRDFRKQDPQAKDALKNGFPLVRVKPGHGAEFIGSRIIPNSLLAGRDLLVKLGYSEDSSKKILRRAELAPEIASLQEQAYQAFVTELKYWLDLGYTMDEVSALLLRIYQEQSGGSLLVRNDRKERRVLLGTMLARLREDKTNNGLQQLAEATIRELQRVS